MAPWATELQQLLRICHNVSMIVDLNVNALKSFSFVFSPGRFKLSVPQLYVTIGGKCLH